MGVRRPRRVSFKAPRPGTPEQSDATVCTPTRAGAGAAHPATPTQDNPLSSVIEELRTLSDALAGQRIWKECSELRRFAAMMTGKLSDSETDMIIFSLIHDTWTLHRLGLNDLASNLVQQVLVLNRAWLNDSDVSFVALELKHDVLASLSRDNEAEQAIREAGRVSEDVHDHDAGARVCRKWSACASRQMKHHEGEKALRRLVQIMQVRPGVEHPGTANAFANLADVLAEQEKYVEAEVWLHRFLYVVEGTKDPEGVAAGLQILAGFLYRRGEIWLSFLGHRRLLSAQEKVYGEGHPETQRTRELLRIMEGIDETGSEISSE
jgi:tetratricopeptide (TPR) repeat protein